MFPIAISMAFELATYGFVSGVVYRRVQHTLPMMFATLLSAMVAGRLVWGAVRFILAGLTGSSFPRSQHSCPARSLPPCPASLPSSF